MIIVVQYFRTLLISMVLKLSLVLYTVLLQIKETLEVKEEEIRKLTNLNDQYNIHYNKKKEIISKLQEEVKSQAKVIDNAKVLEEKYANQMAPLKDQLNLEVAKNRSLGKPLINIKYLSVNVNNVSMLCSAFIYNWIEELLSLKE